MRSIQSLRRTRSCYLHNESEHPRTDCSSLHTNAAKWVRSL